MSQRLENRFGETQITLTFVAIALFLVALPFQFLRAKGRTFGIRALTWSLTIATYSMFLRHSIVVIAVQPFRSFAASLTSLLIALAVTAFISDCVRQNAKMPNHRMP